VGYRVISPRKAWRSLSWVRDRNHCRISIPFHILSRIPWSRNVKRALVWAEELPDRAVIHIELFKPPRIAPEHLATMMPKLLYEFEYTRFRKDNVIRAFSKVFDLTDEDLELIDRTYDELKGVVKCRRLTYPSLLTA